MQLSTRVMVIVSEMWIMSLRIECLIDLRWDGLDLCSELVFDTIEVVSIFESDEIYSKTQMAKSPGSTDSMQICFRVLGEIKVYYNID